MPGLVAIVAPTDAEAPAKKDALDALIDFDAGLALLSDQTGLPVERLALEEPLPSDVRDPSEFQGSRSRYELTLALARGEDLTVRQLLVRLMATRGQQVVAGSPTTIADLIEEWFQSRACDGFNLQPATLPQGLEDFVELVVPELQRRGLFRREYTGSTLRDHLGIPDPRTRR